MNTTTRFLTVFLSSVLAGYALFLGGFELREESESREFEGAGASPGMNTLFYEMRLYGNPDVDIQDRLWQVSTQQQAKDAQAFFKSARTTSSVWTELGPWNIGGRIRSIVASPADPEILYAGSASGGVWKSTDFGLNWDPCTDHMPLLGIGAIALDPNNPNRIFAGTGEPLDQYGRINATFVLSKSQGILRSDDAGLSWTLLPWASGSINGVHRIAVSPVTADTFLVATMNDLWKTTNGGKDWIRSYSGTMSDVVYKPGSSSTVYAAVGVNGGGYKNGVYVSDAGGASGSWRRLSNNFPAADSCGRIVLGVSPADPERIYAAVALAGGRVTSRNADFFLVMSSTNGGQTWIRKINAISKSFTNGQSWYDLAIGVSPKDPNTVFLGGLEIYRSTNGGASFSKKQGSAHVDIHSFAFKANESETVVVGCDGGVFVSPNLGTSWTARSNKLATVQYYGCAYDPAHPTWVFGGTQDNGTHARINGTNSEWAVVFGGDGGNTAIDPSNYQYTYVTSMSIDGQGNYVRPIVRSGPGGTAWLSNGLNDGPATDRFSWMPPVLFHPNENKLYTATQFIYQMKNPSGSSPLWQVVSIDVAGGGGVVSDLAIPPSNTNYMYSVSSNGRAYVCKNLSSNDPAWENISAGLPTRWIADVTCDKDDYQTVFIAVSGFGTGHVYKTTDAGASWTNISGDLPDIPAGAIIQSRTDGNLLFVATDLGVYASTNGGVNWKRYGDDMPNAVVYDMKLTTDGTLIAATHGRGMWIASSLLAAEGPTFSVAHFGLGQNFPNPVSETTTIPVSALRSGRLRLDVYNSSGQRVRTLVDRRIEAGEHLVPFRTDTLPPGVYVTSATMDGVTKTRKMLLLR